MSRFCGDRNITETLAAAERWRDVALIKNGSIFSDKLLWTIEGLTAFHNHFNQNLDAGSGGFWGKLQAQLANTTPQVKQLASELNWLLLLCLSNTHAGAKRDRVREVWAWSGDPLPDLANRWLSDAVLQGIGSGGTGFNNHRWREMAFCIDAILAFKKLQTNEQKELLDDGWRFAEWLQKVPQAEIRQFRHMLLFLLFPDQFERIFGSTDRKRIVRKLGGLPETDVNNMKPLELDKHLLEIRQKLEKEHETADLDFYLDPIRELWLPADHQPPSPPVEELPIRNEDAYHDLFMDQDIFSELIARLRRKKNLILQGPPGVGKTFLAKRIANALMGENAENRVKMVQFHASYAYEDFIQGYRPTGTGFHLKNGVFHEFSRVAENDPTHDYMFIIDEINRANLSKVLGEVMMLIESDKRGRAWAIPLTYAQSPEDLFCVPANLYVLGLMNTADRSLAMVDYALRRRFAFMDVEPGFSTSEFKAYLSRRGCSEAIVNRIVSDMQALNEEITRDQTNLGKGFCIGHSYFCPPEGIEDDLNIDWYHEIIRSEVLPLLNEYWFDDTGRLDGWKQRLLSM